MSITLNELLAAGILLWLCIFLAMFGFELTRSSYHPPKYILYGVIMIVWFTGVAYLYKSVLDKERAWFASGKDLLCERDNERTIVSISKGYIYRDGYYIKDKEIIDEIVCTTLN